MALLSDIVCLNCGETKMVSHSINTYPTICDDCAEKEKSKEKEAFLSQRKTLSLEERVALLEEYVYHEINDPKPSMWLG